MGLSVYRRGAILCQGLTMGELTIIVFTVLFVSYLALIRFRIIKRPPGWPVYLIFTGLLCTGLMIAAMTHIQGNGSLFTRYQYRCVSRSLCRAIEAYQLDHPGAVSMQDVISSSNPGYLKEIPTEFIDQKNGLIRDEYGFSASVRITNDRILIWFPLAEGEFIENRNAGTFHDSGESMFEDVDYCYELYCIKFCKARPKVLLNMELKKDDRKPIYAADSAW
jgi:hypothetical protein